MTAVAASDAYLAEPWWSGLCTSLTLLVARAPFRRRARGNSTRGLYVTGCTVFPERSPWGLAWCATGGGLPRNNTEVTGQRQAGTKKQ